MAEGAAPGRFGPRPQRVAHRDAGTGPAEMRRRGIRFPALPSRLLSVLSVLPAADAVPDDASRQAGPAGAPAGIQYLRKSSSNFDFKCAAPAGAASGLAADHPSRPAGKIADAAAGE